MLRHIFYNQANKKIIDEAKNAKQTVAEALLQLLKEDERNHPNQRSIEEQVEVFLEPTVPNLYSSPIFKKNERSATAMAGVRYIQKRPLRRSIIGDVDDQVSA